MQLKNIIAGAIFILLCPMAIKAQNIGTEVFTHDMLSISTFSPPGLMWMEDSKGRRAGVNPSYQLDKYGILEDKKGMLHEIPNCSPEWDNEGDITKNDQPNPRTYWLITTNDAQGQAYTVHIKGILNGIQVVKIADNNVDKNAPPIAKQPFSFLVTPDSMKTIKVSVNSGFSFVVTRLVGKDDLLDDVKSACHQDLIDSKVCKLLEKKTEAIQDALEKGHKEEAGKLVRSFLCNLGALKGAGVNDQDDHDAIRGPALSILIADAKALLQTLPNNDHH